jgi:mRNA-degrading endonuclease RelE of RelBE toxin-antitoxin system
MSKVNVRQMPAFKRAYKKLHPNQKEAVNETIRAIIADPAIGEPKRGDLAGVYQGTVTEQSTTKDISICAPR